MYISYDRRNSQDMLHAGEEKCIEDFIRITWKEELTLET
jgi:hypothetical protein